MCLSEALKIRDFFDPFLLLNDLGCVSFAVIFSVSKPLFYYWDELAFWGTSAKATSLFHRLYSVWPTPLHNHLPPSNALLSYFFQLCSADFQPWRLLCAYAFLFFAVFALVAQLAYQKSGSLPFAVAVWIVLLLTPFMCVTHLATPDHRTLLYAYGTAMVDLNMAIVFMAVPALYLASPQKKWWLLPLAFLVNMKNTGIFFALLAVCVVLCFVLFDAPAGKKWAALAKTGALALVVAGLAYGSWFVHLAAFEPKAQAQVVLQDAAYLAQKAQEVTADRAVGRELLSVLVPSLRSQSYRGVMATMRQEFLSQKTNLFLPDRWFVPLLAAAAAFAVLCTEKGRRLRAACVAAGIGVGCLVYAAVIGYFVSYYPNGMVEYGRYMSSYYFLWLYVIVLLAAQGGRWRRLWQAALCAVSLAALLLIGRTGLDYTAINAPDTPYLEYMQTQRDTQWVRDILQKGDRVYLVLPDQDTWGYVNLSYHLMPGICNQDTKGSGIDFTISFREALPADSERQYYNIASPALLAELMQGYFDYVYVVRPDEAFVRSYGQLFSDGMTEGTLYRVTEQAVPMQAV